MGYFILYSSWYLKDRNGREEFIAGPRIQDAIYFDVDDIATPTTITTRFNTKLNLPHMMPSKELFASAMDVCGISNDDHIIVYGAKDCVSFHEHR